VPRVCAVSYLNTVPLVWGMLHGPQRGRFDLSFCIPSECADRLAAGTAEIGIVPSIELARQPLDVIPGAGIACHGPVRSILLVTKVRPERIRTLAADSSSRSSVMLSRIILARRYGAEPRLVTMPPSLPAMLQAADAALIIGDPALRLDPDHLPLATLDLGAEWCELTGLPMVFAVWGRRNGAAGSDLAGEFLGSCRYGLANLDEIVRREAPSRNMTEALAREYLTRHIVFELGDREYEGMRLFLQYARDFDTVVSTGGVTASL
jgi:chorismate dehydratase